MQEEILKLLEKKGMLFGSEIVKLVQRADEAKECVRRSLVQLRKYNEIGFICATKKDGKVKITKKNGKLFDEVLEKLKEHDNNGQLRGECYLYFLSGNFK